MNAQLETCPSGPHPAAGVPTLLGWIDIDGLPEQVGRVRRRVRRLLGAAHPLVAEVELLTSEAVTNAIEHTTSGAAGGRVTVRLLAAGRRIRVETVDGGGTGTQPTQRRDLWAEDGRGLWLIAAIADDHGYLPGPAGGTFWFDLSWD